MLATALPAPSSLVSSFAPSYTPIFANTFAEGQKSTGQKLGDATRGGSDNASQQGEGVLKQAQDGLSNAASSVQNALGGSKQ